MGFRHADPGPFLVIAFHTIVLAGLLPVVALHRHSAVGVILAMVCGYVAASRGRLKGMAVASKAADRRMEGQAAVDNESRELIPVGMPTTSSRVSPGCQT
jgi:hypothetical protein